MESRLIVIRYQVKVTLESKQVYHLGSSAAPFLLVTALLPLERQFHSSRLLPAPFLHPSCLSSTHYYVLRVDFPQPDLLQHCMRQLRKDLADVHSSFGRTSHEGHAGLGRSVGGRHQVRFVAHDHDLCSFIGVVVNFLEPGVDAEEGVWACEIVDEYDSDCIFVVCPGDGPEAFLSCLLPMSITVSQICILTVDPSTLIFLVANSTPMVGLLSAMKESLMNLLRMVLLPTEVSPMRMYFMMQSQSKVLSIITIYHRQSQQPGLLIHEEKPKTKTSDKKTKLRKWWTAIETPEFIRSLLQNIINLYLKGNMLKDTIVIVDPSKKHKIVSEELYYEKIKLIGEGTFGKVYLARHKKNDKVVALKEVLQDPKYKNRELSIIARVQHCNIIFMHDYFLKVVKKQKGQDIFLSIVMDYIPSNLTVLIKEQRKIKKPFPPPVRKVLVFQLFKALYYMSLTNLCHRDLKPPNILINPQTFEVKICDFGSAKIFDKAESNVAYICSRYYRAPELVMQATDYHTEIDVWSIGCIMVELLTLQPIFPGDSSQEQLIEIIKILGTPPQKYLNLYQKQRQTEYNLPQIKANSWQLILQKYKPELELVDLISRMLTYDVKRRLTPLQGLMHEYFSDLIDLKDYTKLLPDLFYFKDLKNAKNSSVIEELEKMYPMAETEFKQKISMTSLQEPLKKEQTPNTCNE